MPLTWPSAREPQGAEPRVMGGKTWPTITGGYTPCRSVLWPLLGAFLKPPAMQVVADSGKPPVKPTAGSGDPAERAFRVLGPEGRDSPSRRCKPPVASRTRNVGPEGRHRRPLCRPSGTKSLVFPTTGGSRHRLRLCRTSGTGKCPNSNRPSGTAKRRPVCPIYRRSCLASARSRQRNVQPLHGSTCRRDTVFSRSVR